MHSKYILKLLELQGVKIKEKAIDDDKIELRLYPKKQKYICPCCKSDKIIHKGNDGFRTMKHIRINKHDCILKLLRMRLKCKDCEATFAHEYDFVEGKKRTTKGLINLMFIYITNSTIKSGAKIYNIAVSTANRQYREVVKELAKQIRKKVMGIAKACKKLILGIDDFSIKKGHRYNTGIHDLRNETVLGIIKGRSKKALREYFDKNPEFKELEPYGVVIDLARYYHEFIKEVYPKAIRVADRFHVNKYVIEAINEIRKKVSKILKSQAQDNLYQNKEILNKRNEKLTKKEKEKLEELLKYSKELEIAYRYKEDFATIYDCSPDYKIAKEWFEAFIERYKSYDIKEINKSIKTLENWKEEILNYHKCSYTNAIVEGKHNRVKALMRRHYFIANREFYVNRLMLEFNNEILTEMHA